MLAHFLKLAVRNFRKHPFFSVISIVGLVIGVGACILLTNYALHEKSFDNFHADGNNIYRVESYFTRNGETTDSWASSSFGYASAIKTELPGIKDITRVDNYDCERIVKYKDIVFRESRAVLADSNFFKFFSYQLLKGDQATVLKEANSVVISESAAKKYFGSEDPMGKVMQVTTQKSKYDCAVTGIFKDFPRNSHLQLDIIISYASSTNWERNSWYMHEAYTYVKLNDNQSIHEIESKFPALAEKYKTEPALKEHQWKIHLVPVSDIHLNALKPYELEQKGSASTINLLFVIAFVILLLSWINYINLFISKAMERAGEVGIRKMAGAGSGHIISQFILEAVLVNFGAQLLFFSIMAVLTSIDQRLGLEDVFYGFWSSPITWDVSVAAFVTGTLLTGIIPAFVLKNLNTAVVLKNKLSFRSGIGNNIRRGLIVFQYFSSIVLIIAALTIRKQILFMRSQDLGISTEQTLVVKTPPKVDTAYDAKMEAFIDRVKLLPGVKAAAVSSAIPGKMVGYAMANRRAGDETKTNRMSEMFRVDYDFMKAYDIQLVRGRMFSKEYSTDRDQAVILTENAMNLFGFKNADEAINSSLNLEGHEEKRFPIIAVVKDYHQLSLKEEMRPIVFMMYNPWKWIDNHFISIKVGNQSTTAMVSSLQHEFKSAFPESSFDHFFLDDYFNQQYQQDIRYGHFIQFFGFLALLIVVFGIISMSGLMLLKRKKEISVRKVHGARTLHILRLINKDFIRMALIASLIGIPVAWFSMKQWLNGFAYRINIDLWMMLGSFAIICFVSIATVTLLSVKTAWQNPVNALRAE